MPKTPTVEYKPHTQIVLLKEIQKFTARVKNLTLHLQKNPKDYSAERGLYQILEKRKRLLKYINSPNIGFTK